MHSQEHACEVLSQFAGTWSTSGVIYANPFIQDGKLSGMDEYKWLDGGFFMIHHVDVVMGGNEVKSIEIIGYDYPSNSYLMNSFDNQGNHVIIHAEYHENSIWKKWMDITLAKSE